MIWQMSCWDGRQQWNDDINNVFVVDFFFPTPKTIGKEGGSGICFDIQKKKLWPPKPAMEKNDKRFNSPYQINDPSFFITFNECTTMY